jgi:predicted RNA-binding Zn-ribbon protein involved in translation (DUF1610 family)
MMDEMSKFTKEFIADQRNIIYDSDNDTEYPRAISIAYKALDEIERLQAEKEQVCEWRYESNQYFTSSCTSVIRQIYLFETDTFCPNCGKKIKYMEEEQP